MIIWVTRSDLWDCIAKGVQRCSVWLERPLFDEAQRGNADRLFAHLPVGWRLPDTGIGADQLQAQVSNLFNNHPALELTLFEAMSRSIDGKGRRDEMYQDWNRLLDDDAYDDVGHRTFVLEMDVPPAIWWTIARLASLTELDQTRNKQAMLTDDELPF